MIVLESDNYRIATEPFETTKGSTISLELNSLSFGYATNTIFTFFVDYDQDHGNFNFEKPQLLTYYATPRFLISDYELKGNPVLAPSMSPGYSSKMMRQYVNENFPEGFHRCQWDYPVAHMDKDTLYVHPDGVRLLQEEELIILYGCRFGCIPWRILDYLVKQASFFQQKAWEKHNFSAVYNPFKAEWEVENYNEKKSAKSYNFSGYTPRLCHPVSGKYHLISRKDH